MSYGKPRDQGKEQQWRRWLRQWQQSGQSVQAFCARHDLTASSFYFWRREIQRRDAANTFLPVQVVCDEEPPPTSILEIVLSGGRAVRVSAGFDPATLRQLLAVLEEVPSC
jgi:transposase